MAIKQTHIYKGHAIVHQVFATDQTSEIFERFVVSQPGKQNNVCIRSTLADAKASVDQIVAPREQYVSTPA
jgi:thymidine phosphorylase